MANIRTGSIVADIRGKVGDEIYSRNRGGAYVKEYAVPTNPDTSHQQLRRTFTADAVAAWQALSDDEAQLWINYVNTSPFIANKYPGRKPSAFNVFVSRYIVKEMIQDSRLPTPNDPAFTANCEVAFNTLTTSSMTANFNWVQGSEYNAGLLYLSPPVSNGKRSINSVSMHWQPWYLDLASGNINTGNFLSLYLTYFGLGSISSGDRIFIGMKNANTSYTSGGSSVRGRPFQMVGVMNWNSAIIS